MNATAPYRPNPVVTFEAIQQSKSQIELRWQNSNNQYIEYTKLQRMIVGQHTNYSEIGRFDINQQDYFDLNFPLGKKILYKITHNTTLGESDAIYDFVHTPYRDISNSSKVYIKKN